MIRLLETAAVAAYRAQLEQLGRRAAEGTRPPVSPGRCQPPDATPPQRRRPT